MFALNGYLNNDFSVSSAREKLLPFLLVATAVPIGFAIGFDDWRILGALAGLFLLVACPVEAAVGLYAFLIPWEDLTLIGQGAGRTTLLWYVGVVAIVVLASIGVLRRSVVRPPRAAILWSLLILWAAASAFWAIKPDKSLERIPTMAGLWLVYVVAVSVRITHKEVSWIALMVVAGGCSASLYSAYQYFHGNALLDFQGPRASLVGGGVQADPNFFAASLLLPLSVAFGEGLSCRNRLRRTIMLGATGVIALAVFLTMSRGALLAVAVMGCVFFYRLRLNWRTFIPLGVLGAALLAMPSLFFQRVQDAVSTRGAGRLDIWQAGLAALAHYCATGAGLENFSDAYSQYVGSSTFYHGYARAAHNMYLGLSVELGILGISLLIAGVVSHLRAMSRMRVSGNQWAPARIAAFEAGCWAVLIAGFFLDLLWRKTFWFSWILLVMVMNTQQKSPEFAEDLARDHQ